jgi:hypothetical protein
MKLTPVIRKPRKLTVVRIYNSWIRKPRTIFGHFTFAEKLLGTSETWSLEREMPLVGLSQMMCISFAARKGQRVVSSRSSPRFHLWQKYMVPSAVAHEGLSRTEKRSTNEINIFLEKDKHTWP